MIARVEAVPNCPSIRRAMREHSMSGRVGISGKLPEICCQHKKPGLIGLDFSTDATDDLFNTSAAPLLEMVLCHSSDAHQRRVQIKSFARNGLHRITATPPLKTLTGRHAHLGWLLFCADGTIDWSKKWLR